MTEPYLSLSKAEKIQIVKNHLKGIQYSRYNLEVSILVEEVAQDSSEATIESMRVQMSDANAKEAVLLERLAQLEAEPDPQPTD